MTSSSAKKIIAVLAVCFFIFSCTNSQNNPKLMGAWEGEKWAEFSPGTRFDDQKRPVEFIFFKPDSLKITTFHTNTEGILKRNKVNYARWKSQRDSLYILDNDSVVATSSYVNYPSEDSLHIIFKGKRFTTHYSFTKTSNNLLNAN